MTKLYEGRLFETHPDWYPVVVPKLAVYADQLRRNAWLYEKCPNGPNDYDAFAYDNVPKIWESRQTIYFFRDPKIAVEFALRWS